MIRHQSNIRVYESRSLQWFESICNTPAVQVPGGIPDTHEPIENAYIMNMFLTVSEFVIHVAGTCSDLQSQTSG